MIETAKISDIVARIVAKFNPDKIILFGSYASGTQNNDSDLDLLVGNIPPVTKQNRCSNEISYFEKNCKLR